MLYYGRPSFIDELPLELSACISLKAGMNSGDLDKLLKGYLEAKFGLALDYFLVEGRMAPDAKGDMGVTGSCRKKPGTRKSSSQSPSTLPHARYRTCRNIEHSSPPQTST